MVRGQDLGTMEPFYSTKSTAATGGPILASLCEGWATHRALTPTSPASSSHSASDAVGVGPCGSQPR
jgi:hypothetical protein